MNHKRSFWFTIDIRHPLSYSEKVLLSDEFAYWEYGTFIVIHTDIQMSPNRLHDILDDLLIESPVAVCIADSVFHILESLEVHYNS